jgi:hypothetical protein
MSLLLSVKYSRGQMKIQQMAFVLVAIMILFAIVAIFYISIRFSTLREDVTDLKKEEIIESVRKISGTPEFLFSSFEDCAACIDLDKAFIIKNRDTYQNFWEGISLLQIERIYPTYQSNECDSQNYPRCNKVTLVKEENYESFESYVSLCRYDSSIEQTKCELGKIVMGFEGLDE